MPLPGFAVIDLETTGFFAAVGDRIVELAVVHLDADGTVTGRFETLIEPYRDLGDTGSHGITADDLVGAPSFADIAPRLLELLDGRILVAHNASFHLPFLRTEFAKAGYSSETLMGLCTMQLARTFVPGAGRTLQDCCDAFDIALPAEHRASADADGAARLLAAYLRDAPVSEVWDRAVPLRLSRPAVPDVGWVARRAQPARAATFLQRITIKMPEFSGPAEQLDYLALLDRALLDRDISLHEADQLVALAEESGISRTTVEELHHQYFEELTAIAWADGVLTEDEVQDLVAVGRLLSIPEPMVDRAMEPFALERVAPVAAIVDTFSLEPDDVIVFSGPTVRPLDAWHDDLRGRGYFPSDAMTRLARIVVAADPDAAGGKVGKARDYGIPVVTEAGLERLLAH